MFDTIAAISSGIINQPISLIRISGPEAFNIIKKVFRGKVGKHQEITYGYIVDNQEKIDEVLVAWFKKPHSFTGENTIEINAHGGIINSNRILSLLLANGARLAEPGEFSRQAFLNGKIDLIKAEAIHDLIFAKTTTQAQLAVNKFDQKTSNYLEQIINQLFELIATIETNIDYPEYDDIEKLTDKLLLPKLAYLNEELKVTIQSSEDLRYITNGIKIAIIGKPNAGKSTLLNALLNDEKAIVSSTPGTTRDVVEGEMVYQGVLFKLFDTAGLHTTKDNIEKQGINKTKEQIKKADLIIHLIDATSKNEQLDSAIMKQLERKIYLQVFNKTDLKKTSGINIEAKNKKIKPLLDQIMHLLPEVNLNNHQLVNNARQLSLIKRAQNNIENAIKALKSGFLPDEAIIDIRQAWVDLTNIKGRADNEQLLDQMFKNFCLGK